MNMKKTTCLVAVLLSFGIIGCAPDLVVKTVNVQWDATHKEATARIANTGNRDAGNFLVYFDAEESPVSQHDRPQVQHNVPGLAKGQSIVLNANFAPLASPGNHFLKNVYKINVIADPKNMVKESNENNNQKSAPVPQGIACMDFDPLPAVGTVYGQPAGNPPGAVVFTESGIRMSVRNFRWTNGGGTFNLARIETPPRRLGSANTIRTSNINLQFDFSALGFPVSQVDVQFLDMGGFENIAVNGQPSPVYAGELTRAPSSIAGVSVNVVTTSLPGGKSGTLTLNGPVTTLTIGGQEFWIDNICARQ